MFFLERQILAQKIEVSINLFPFDEDRPYGKEEAEQVGWRNRFCGSGYLHFGGADENRVSDRIRKVNSADKRVKMV